MIADVKNVILWHWNTLTTRAQWHSWSQPQLCSMLNWAVNRSASLGFSLVRWAAEVTVWRPADDSWHGGRFRRGPMPRLPGFGGGSGSADQHRCLPGLVECQHPDGWWVTRLDTCWLQVKSGLVQNGTWLTFVRSPLLFSLWTFPYGQLVFLLLCSSFDDF